MGKLLFMFVKDINSYSTINILALAIETTELHRIQFKAACIGSRDFLAFAHRTPVSDFNQQSAVAVRVHVWPVIPKSYQPADSI